MKLRQLHLLGLRAGLFDSTSSSNLSSLSQQGGILPPEDSRRGLAWAAPPRTRVSRCTSLAPLSARQQKLSKAEALPALAKALGADSGFSLGALVKHKAGEFTS